MWVALEARGAGCAFENGDRRGRPGDSFSCTSTASSWWVTPARGPGGIPWPAVKTSPQVCLGCFPVPETQSGCSYSLETEKWFSAPQLPPAVTATWQIFPALRLRPGALQVAAEAAVVGRALQSVWAHSWCRQIGRRQAKTHILLSGGMSRFSGSLPSLHSATLRPTLGS